MPACFTLTPRHDPEHGPQAMPDIDKVICDHFKVECHPKYWYHGWYDNIGFMLAVGKTFAEIKAYYLRCAEMDEAIGDIAMAEFDLISFRIASFLETNYISDSWHEISRRH